MNTFARTLSSLPALVFGGMLAVLSTSGASSAQCAGPAWSYIGGTDVQTEYSYASDIRALTIAPNGDLIAGGNFATIGGGMQANRIARWNGTVWSLVAPNTFDWRSSIDAVAVWPNGDILAVGGVFESTSGGFVSYHKLMRTNGATWSEIGPGAGPRPRIVGAVAIMPNGDVVAAGEFRSAAGSTLSGIRVGRWDGTVWTLLGTQGFIGGDIHALAVMPNGDIVAGGAFTKLNGAINRLNGVARWDGTAWQPLSTGVTGFEPTVDSMTVMPNGDLIVAGAFNTIGGVSVDNIARWNGVVWSRMGIGVGNIPLVLATPSGDVYAAGSFLTSFGSIFTGVARWRNEEWQHMGADLHLLIYKSLAFMPSGLLVACGRPTINDPNMPIAVFSDCAACCASDGSCTIVTTGIATSVCPGGTLIASASCEPSPCSVVSSQLCCRGVTCNSVAVNSCTGMVAGSASVVVSSCGTGSALASCCFADFNHDGNPSIDDLFLYLNAYFTGSPWANYGGDGVETPTIDDLFLYINAYFTGCL